MGTIIGASNGVLVGIFTSNFQIGYFCRTKGAPHLVLAPGIWLHFQHTCTVTGNWTPLTTGTSPKMLSLKHQNTGQCPRKQEHRVVHVQTALNSSNLYPRQHETTTPNNDRTLQQLYYMYVTSTLHALLQSPSFASIPCSASTSFVTAKPV